MLEIYKTCMQLLCFQMKWLKLTSQNILRFKRCWSAKGNLICSTLRKVAEGWCEALRIKFKTNIKKYEKLACCYDAFKSKWLETKSQNVFRFKIFWYVEGNFILSNKSFFFFNQTTPILVFSGKHHFFNF